MITGNEKKIMIYCLNIHGHRQVYCNVLAQWALSRGFFIYIVYAGRRRFYNGKIIMEPFNSQYIDFYKDNKNVKLINILNVVNDFNYFYEMEIISDLKKDLKADFTFLVDGKLYTNNFINLAKSYSSRRIIEPVVFNFDLDTSFYYSNIIRRYLRVKDLKRITHVDKMILFDEFLFEELGSEKFGFIPDISMSFNYKYSIDTNSDFSAMYNEFLNKNKGKEIILYFGEANYRKGYDLLLSVAAADKDTVFVFCGEVPDYIKKNLNLLKLKNALEDEKRTFFIEGYVTDDYFINQLFSSTNFVILGHRDHYLTSGTMVQALINNKPVLVPDIGLTAKRVEKNNIGMTYKHGSLKDLSIKFNIMRKDYNIFIDSVISYKDFYSKESIFYWMDNNIEMFITK